MLKHTQLSKPESGRSGITLTEVLSSILIMGLGVTFVISLFPVALARSLKASQLTNAALGRWNAEATIDLVPGIIHDPDGDGNLIEHFQSPIERDYLVDPWGYNVHWLDLGGSGSLPITRGANIRDWMGNDGASTPAAVGVLPRYSGGVTTESAAAGLVGSRDGWVTHVDVEIDSTATGVTSVVLPADADLSTLLTDASGAPLDTRVILYNDFRGSAAFPVTAFNDVTKEVTWSETVSGSDANGNGEIDHRALPDEFGSVVRVVVEVAKARQYSWMLTVRKGTDGQAGVDVVVMFNRGVDPKNEELFQATFVPSTSGAFANRVLVKNQATNGREPFLKKGGFVLDAVNARWYRIQGYDPQPLVGAWPHGDYDHVLRVDQPIIEAAGEDFGGGTAANALNGILDAGEDADGDGALPGTAIFLPGVVEVYPLGTKALPESL